MVEPRTYQLQQSPLYRLTSKKRLALLLGISASELKLLCDLQDHNFKRWELGQRERDKLIGLPAKAKKRSIQQPKTALHAVHKRIALLLGRIEKPAFVYSATKRRSYVDNAIQHQRDEPCVKVDVKDFYRHVKFGRVRRFFLENLQCADDVAHVLATLCCVDGALATGSAVSPVLSYFACASMFAEIEDFAQRRRLVFTLYVDDMVFSGAAANRAFADGVRHLLKGKGFVGHKVTCYRAHDVKVVTGVAVRAGFVDLPFSRQGRIRRTEAAFATSTDPNELRILGRALLGQYREAERIKPGIKAKAAPVEARLRSLGLMATRATNVRKKPRKLKKGARVFDELRAQRKKLLARQANATSKRDVPGSADADYSVAASKRYA